MQPKRPDLHHSQTVKVADVLGREPEQTPAPAPDPEAELEEQRRRASERDQLVALEVRLVGDKIRKQTEHTGKIVDLCRDMLQKAPITDAMLEAIRENRDATQMLVPTLTVELPQLFSMLISELREIKESIQAIAVVVTAKGTNGHLQEG